MGILFSRKPKSTEPSRVPKSRQMLSQLQDDPAEYPGAGNPHRRDEPRISLDLATADLSVGGRIRRQLLETERQGNSLQQTGDDRQDSIPPILPADLQGWLQHAPEVDRQENRQQGNGQRHNRLISPNFSVDDYMTEEECQFLQDNLCSLQDTQPCLNLGFYQNGSKSTPAPGHTLDEILMWKGKYDILGKQLSYIVPWLFPVSSTLDETSDPQHLLPHEIVIFSSSTFLGCKLLAAYDIMLDFYGMDLKSSDTGEVTRGVNWKARFEHLNSHEDDQKQIPRILASLGCLGYARFQYPWVMFMLTEVFVTGKLKVSPRILQSCIDVMSDEHDKLACAHFFDVVSPSVIEHGYGHVDSDLSRAKRQTSVDSEIKTGNYVDNKNEQHGNRQEDRTYRGSVVPQVEMEDRTCKICLDEQIQVAFVPCGHTMACQSCASMVKKCCICRGDVKKLLRIYIA